MEVTLFNTIEEADLAVRALTTAQTLLLASVLRLLIDKNAFDESDLSEVFDSVDQAAMQRRTAETPYLIGLTKLLRSSVGLTEQTHRDV